MLKEIWISLLFCAAVALFIRLLRGALLTPVPHGRDQRLIVTLCMQGSVPELEQTVKSLLWLHAQGTLHIDRIIFRDEGMDEETRQTARQLIKKDHRIGFED